jgi:protein TonB
MSFAEGMTRPQRTAGEDPRYSREALEARVEGTMLVKCVVTAQGDVQNCQVIKPLPHMERAVLDALSTWRMKPAVYQGKPVAVSYIFPFRLVMPNR